MESATHHQIIEVFQIVKKTFEVNVPLANPDWKAMGESIALVEDTLKDLNGQYVESVIGSEEELHDDEMLMNSQKPKQEAWV